MSSKKGGPGRPIEAGPEARKAYKQLVSNLTKSKSVSEQSCDMFKDSNIYTTVRLDPEHNEHLRSLVSYLSKPPHYGNLCTMLADRLRGYSHYQVLMDWVRTANANRRAGYARALKDVEDRARAVYSGPGTMQQPLSNDEIVDRYGRLCKAKKSDSTRKKYLEDLRTLIEKQPENMSQMTSAMLLMLIDPLRTAANEADRLGELPQGEVHPALRTEMVVWFGKLDKLGQATRASLLALCPMSLFHLVPEVDLLGEHYHNAQNKKPVAEIRLVPLGLAAPAPTPAPPAAAIAPPATPGSSRRGHGRSHGGGGDTPAGPSLAGHEEDYGVYMGYDDDSDDAGVGPSYARHSDDDSDGSSSSDNAGMVASPAHHQHDMASLASPGFHYQRPARPAPPSAAVLKDWREQSRKRKGAASDAFRALSASSAKSKSLSDAQRALWKRESVEWAAMLDPEHDPDLRQLVAYLAMPPRFIQIDTMVTDGFYYLWAPLHDHAGTRKLVLERQYADDQLDLEARARRYYAQPDCSPDPLTRHEIRERYKTMLGAIPKPEKHANHSLNTFKNLLNKDRHLSKVAVETLRMLVDPLRDPAVRDPRSRLGGPPQVCPEMAVELARWFGDKTKHKMIRLTYLDVLPPHVCASIPELGLLRRHYHDALNKERHVHLPDWLPQERAPSPPTATDHAFPATGHASPAAAAAPAAPPPPAPQEEDFRYHHHRMPQSQMMPPPQTPQPRQPQNEGLRGPLTPDARVTGLQAHAAAFVEQPPNLQSQPLSQSSASKRPRQPSPDREDNGEARGSSSRAGGGERERSSRDRRDRGGNERGSGSSRHTSRREAPPPPSRGILGGLGSFLGGGSSGSSSSSSRPRPHHSDRDRGEGSGAARESRPSRDPEPRRSTATATTTATSSGSGGTGTAAKKARRHEHSVFTPVNPGPSMEARGAGWHSGGASDANREHRHREPADADPQPTTAPAYHQPLVSRPAAPGGGGYVPSHDVLVEHGGNSVGGSGAGHNTGYGNDQHNDGRYSDPTAHSRR